MNQKRLQQVLENMKKAGLEQIIVTETEPVYYLTGIWVAPLERMMAVYIHSSGKVTFFGNKLFGVQPQEGMELVEHTDSDDPGCPAGTERAARQTGHRRNLAQPLPDWSDGAPSRRAAGHGFAAGRAGYHVQG